MKPMSVMYDPALLSQPAGTPPSQTVSRRNLARRPEMRLVAAMFDDAVECIVGNVAARCGTRRREFVEARDWLWDDTRGWPFAFANVCDLLGFEATAVRARLDTIVPGAAARERRAVTPPCPPATFWATGVREVRPRKDV